MILFNDLEAKRFDVRMIERARGKGEVSLADYENYVKTLEDDSDLVDDVVLEDTSSVSSLSGQTH